MTLFNYLYKNGIYITLYIVSVFLIDSLLYILNINIPTILFIDFLIYVPLILTFFYKYYQKKKFFDELFYQIEHLDKSYYVTEIVEKPNFMEGELLMEALYSINKSMNENVKELEIKHKDFKEYLEMWIHEIKTPVSSLTLLLHNQNNIKAYNQVHKIDNYLEQILFYFRSEVSEKDFLIKSISLQQLFNTVLIKNMETILEQNIQLDVHDLNVEIISDMKWLEFVIQQILTNSMKYMDKEEKILSIYSSIQDNTCTLTIKDNGIGIPSYDLPRVFDKSFTGDNGRRIKNSTGMGLYISKNLIEKLGHTIYINSVQNEYTEVHIVFSNVTEL